MMNTSENTHCSVCDMKFCKTRLKVKCNECNYVACNGCYKSFLCANDVMEIRCMNCFNVFKKQDFFTQMPQRFFYVNEERCADILYSKVEHLIPDLELMKNMELECRAREIELRDKKKEMVELKNRMREIKYDIGNLESLIYQKRKQSFTSVIGNKCIYPSCIGFIDKHTEKCRVCELSVCNKCNSEKTENHKCSEDDIKSNEYISRNSQKCPNCKVAVSKVDGCDDMWCVNCKTKFSYVSGKVITRIIHNPHLNEYVKNNGENFNEQLLNDCNPVARPPRELLNFATNWGPEGRHPYSSFVNHLVTINYQLENEVGYFDNHLSDEEITRRKYTILVNMMIKDGATKKEKQILLEEYRHNIVCEKARDILTTFKDITTEMLWLIVDKHIGIEDIHNKTDNFYTELMKRHTEMCMYYLVCMTGCSLLKHRVNICVNEFTFNIIPDIIGRGYYDDKPEDMGRYSQEVMAILSN